MSRVSRSRLDRWLISALLCMITLPAAAQTDALFVDADGDVGIGTSTPSFPLSVVRPEATVQDLLSLEASNATSQTLRLRLANASETWFNGLTSIGNLTFNSTSNPQIELFLTPDGDLHIRGTLTANGSVFPSSRTLKTGFRDVDSKEVLARLSAVPVSLWKYRSDAEGTPHIGPVAEDFASAFEYLEIDGRLNSIDLHGVTIAAIQGLHQLIEERDSTVDLLQREIESRDARIARLEARLIALEELLAP